MGLKSKVKKALQILRSKGVTGLVRKIIQRKETVHQVGAYRNWLNEYESFLNSRPASERLRFSILMPVFNTKPEHLMSAIESVRSQNYGNWQLCICDDASNDKATIEVLKKVENDERVRLIRNKKNEHISHSTNKALELADGEWVVFLDHDDMLHPAALSNLAYAIEENPDSDIVYSDEDKIDEDGRRFEPFMKPDWSPHTLLSFMYLCHMSAYRTRFLRETGGLRAGFEGAQDYDLALRATEKTENIVHIPKILYHWRVHPESTAGGVLAKPYALGATIRALDETFGRRGIAARAGVCVDNRIRVQFALPNKRVSVIVLAKDHVDMTLRCLESVAATTRGIDTEIILVDNNSVPEARSRFAEYTRERNIVHIVVDEPFNYSAFNNLGADKATGHFLCFLNNDVEVLSSNWLDQMCGYAGLPDAGIVGTKLLFPDFSIQHCGMVNSKNHGPTHSFMSLSDKDSLYFDRNKQCYNWLMVTGACVVIETKKYNAIGRFDPDFVVAYNDVDLCIRAIKNALYNVCVEDLAIIHYESRTRGNDFASTKGQVRLAAESELFKARHPEFATVDPFYSPFLEDDGSFKLKSDLRS